MSEEDYSRATYDMVMAAAQTLARLSPSMTFIYVSGAATDGTEQGRTMWARVLLLVAQWGPVSYSANRPRLAAMHRLIIGNDRQSKNSWFPICVSISTAFLCASQ